MLKALESIEKESETPAGALVDFEQAAKKGMDSTKGMLAKKGRTSRLGEKPSGTKMPALLHDILFCCRWQRRLQVRLSLLNHHTWSAF